MQQIIALVKDGGGKIPQHSVWAIEIKDGEATILRMPTTNLHRAHEYLRVIQVSLTPGIAARRRAHLRFLSVAFRR